MVGSRPEELDLVDRGRQRQPILLVPEHHPQAHQLTGVVEEHPRSSPCPENSVDPGLAHAPYLADPLVRRTVEHPPILVEALSGNQ